MKYDLIRGTYFQISVFAAGEVKESVELMCCIPACCSNAGVAVKLLSAPLMLHPVYFSYLLNKCSSQRAITGASELKENFTVPLQSLILLIWTSCQPWQERAWHAVSSLLAWLHSPPTPPPLFLYVWTDNKPESKLNTCSLSLSFSVSLQKSQSWYNVSPALFFFSLSLLRLSSCVSVLLLLCVAVIWNRRVECW